MILLTLFRFAFASAPRLYRLTSHHIVTRRPVLQKVRHHTRMVLCLLVSSRFQVLFHSPPGVLFTFPSRYYSLSVIWSYLAFRDGPRFFRQDSSCPDVLRIPLRFNPISPTGVSPSALCLSKQVRLSVSCVLAVLTPRMHCTRGLGCSDFARHYSRNRSYFLFLRVLRCFSSPGSPPIPMCSEWDNATLLALSSLIRKSADQDVCSSPQLFAAYHVLLRRHIPRHPP